MILSRHLQFLLIPTLMTFSKSEAGGHTERHGTENYKRTSTMVPQHHQPQKAPPKNVVYGTNSFKNFILAGHYYYDKTEFILNLTKRLDPDRKLFSFSRPRQCGKTLTMLLLKDFFNVNEIFTSFANKTWDIMGNDEEHKKLRDVFMNKWPVIFLSFIDSDGAATNEALTKSICDAFHAAYSEFQYLRNSTKLDTYDEKTFIRFVDEIPPEIGECDSLRFLCKLLKKHHGLDPIIILDEADSPLAAATSLGSYDTVAGWMHQLLNIGLRGNQNYKMAIISSVTPFAAHLPTIGREKYTISDTGFETSFGFVQPEVEKILDESKKLKDVERKKLLNNVSKWYNNFKIGNAAIFNPYSIVQCRLAHWKIGEFADPKSSLQKITSCIFENCGLLPLVSFDILIEVGELEVCVDSWFEFPDLLKRPEMMWGYLYHCGIVTLDAIPSEENGHTVKVNITDQDIREMMKTYIKPLFVKKALSRYSKFIKIVGSGNDTAVRLILEEYIQIFEQYPSTTYLSGNAAAEKELAQYVELIIRKFKPENGTSSKTQKVLVTKRAVQVYVNINDTQKKFIIKRKRSNTTSWGTAFANAFSKDKIIDVAKNKVVQILGSLSFGGMFLNHFVDFHNWWPFH